MNPRTKTYKGMLMVFVSMGLVLMAPATASAADPDPIGDLLNGVTKALTPPAPKSAVEPPPPTPGNDSDSPGNETVDPVAPDHAASEGAKVGTPGTPLLGAIDDRSTVNDDDSTQADSTLLSLFGMEIAGAHADSTGDNQNSFDPLAPLTTPICDGSAGGLCLNALYADTSATDDGTTSNSQSSSGAASGCIGGTSTDGSCTDGVVSLGVTTSETEAERNQPTGQTTATSSFETVGLCLAQTLGVCTVGVSALSSDGQADSGPNTTSDGTASRGSSLADLNVQGTSLLGPITDPMAIAVPVVLDLFLNQGETYLGPGVAGTAQDALKLIALPGLADLTTVVGRTETLVHNDGGEPPVEPPVVNPPKDDDDDSDEPDDAALPDTGGPRAGLLGIGLLGIAAGSLAVAYGRRERRTLV